MIKGLKICGVSDPKTLYYILDHRHKPSMIGFITNYEKSRTRFKTRFLCSCISILIKEDKSFALYKDAIESGVIMYLKEQGEYENLLKEEGEVPSMTFEQEPYMTCFGIDVYDLGGQLISEKEYAQTL